MLQKLEILSFKNVLNLILVPQGFVHMRYLFFSEYKGNTHTGVATGAEAGWGTEPTIGLLFMHPWEVPGGLWGGRFRTE